MPTALRSGLLLLLLLGSVGLAVLAERATPAALCLLGAMALMVQLPKLRSAAARGPGKWRPVEFDSLEFRAFPRSYAWLDIGTPTGLLWFTLSAAALTIIGLRLLGTSPYLSSMCLVYGCLLVPLFCTLGSVMPSALEQQSDVLSQLKQQLQRKTGLLATEVGRFVENPEAPSLTPAEPDELRLKIAVAHAASGLLGIELGVELHQAPLAPLRLPVIVVRVRDGSPAHEALPREAQWSRGSEPDERVALLRPALPHVRMTVDLLRSVMRALVKPAEAEGSKVAKAPRAAKVTTPAPTERSTRRVA